MFEPTIWKSNDWCRQAYLFAFLDSDNTENHEYRQGESKCIFCGRGDDE